MTEVAPADSPPVCARCGVAFEALDGGQKYCSEQCKRAARTRRKRQRRRGCASGKKGYRNREAALLAAAGANRADVGFTLRRAYRCPACKAWHTTKQG